MAGAAEYGLDAVFVASGLHVGPGGEGLDDLRLAELFEGRKAPRAAMPALALVAKQRPRESLLLQCNKGFATVAHAKSRSRGDG